MQKTLLAVLTLLFSAGIASAQTPHQTFSIPFREVNHRILVDVKVGNRPVTLLFDTGARASASLGTTTDYQLYMQRGKFSCVGEITIAFQQAEVHFDGFLGADITSKFASVTIDYTNHVIVFTEKP